jgi:hypothetical protein
MHYIKKNQYPLYSSRTFITFFRFLEAFDLTAEMQFLPDLLAGDRPKHVLDLQND